MDIPQQTTIILTIGVLCEMVLLVFLFFISRFYQVKFGQRTHSYAFLAPPVAYLILIVAVTLGFDTFLAGVIVNLVTLLVLIIFGTRLYRMMMGVSK